jgi:hypothetical protein
LATTLEHFLKQSLFLALPADRPVLGVPIRFGEFLIEVATAEHDIPDRVLRRPSDRLTVNRFHDVEVIATSDPFHDAPHRTDRYLEPREPTVS